MQAVGRYGVRRDERPVGEDRLTDLKAVGDPIDAAEQGLFVHAGRRRGGQSKHDLRLDPRLGQTAQRNVQTLFRQVMARAVVDVSPHWRMDVVFGPDGPVGETDLAPDRPLSARLPPRPNLSGDPICLVQAEFRPTGGERRNLTAGPQDGEGLSCNVLDIHLARPPATRDGDGSGAPELAPASMPFEAD